ncbi:MAG: GNAT family protein [Polyangia bacterium]
MSTIVTPRLELVPMSLELVEAVMSHDRDASERIAGAVLPKLWPNHALIERAFFVSLDAIRAEPERRLWGDRLCISRTEPRRVVGSVVFHGRPDDGICELGYGIEEGSQRDGLATEATAACVAWAFQHDYVKAVRATTFSWHKPSLRVMEKLGMTHIGTEQHDTLGEMLVYEVRR